MAIAEGSGWFQRKSSQPNLAPLLPADESLRRPTLAGSKGNELGFGLWPMVGSMRERSRGSCSQGNKLRQPTL
jgi:hypothetical protein